jgi:hypothetical protein
LICKGLLSGRLGGAATGRRNAHSLTRWRTSLKLAHEEPGRPALAGPLARGDESVEGDACIQRVKEARSPDVSARDTNLLWTTNRVGHPA